MNEKTERTVWIWVSHILWMFLASAVVSSCTEDSIKREAIKNNSAHYEIVDQAAGRTKLVWGPQSK